jgi:hypothetical protein
VIDRRSQKSTAGARARVMTPASRRRRLAVFRSCTQRKIARLDRALGMSSS